MSETKQIEKYESLVRLKDEDKLISPYFFLDISKKTKQYSTITKTMIEKSFKRFKDNDLEFSVNLTIPSAIAYIVSSLPILVFKPGRILEPRWRMIILPILTFSPAYFLVPKR